MDELIAALERAEGPDRALDARIHVLTQLAEFGDIDRDIENALWVVSHEADEDESPIAEYTASIDAALTLVPEGWVIDSLKEGEIGSWYVNLRPRGWVGEWVYSKAATPAIALCIAALKARASS